jgi:signal peptide peptidase SppA
MRKALRPQPSFTEDGLAILPVHGVLARKPDVFEMAFYGVEDTSAAHEAFDALIANPQVKGILLDIDSPGGFMTGGPEFAQSVRHGRDRKPVHAWTGGGMASLAYWIGSQATRITASLSAQIGSIGAYTTVTDISKMYEAHGVHVEVIKNKEAAYKAAGIEGTSLTSAQRSHLQERIQAGFDMFSAAVLSARGSVSANVMKGQVLNGEEARTAGLVDFVGSRDSALKLLKLEVRSRG